MTDTNKIVAAIFTAAVCSRQPTGYKEYLTTHEMFLKLMGERAEATRPQPQIHSL